MGYSPHISGRGWRVNSFAACDLKGDGSLAWAFIEGSGNLVITTAGGQKVSAIGATKELAGYTIASRPGQGGLLITLDHGIVQAYTFQP